MTQLSVMFGAVAGACLDAHLRFADDQSAFDYVAVAAYFVVWQASYAALHHLSPWRALSAVTAEAA